MAEWRPSGNVAGLDHEVRQSCSPGKNLSDQWERGFLIFANPIDVVPTNFGAPASLGLAKPNESGAAAPFGRRPGRLWARFR